MARKRIIIFNDLCGIGTVALKMNLLVVMANGIEAVSVPTTIFSAPMNYKGFVRNKMPEFENYVDSIENIYGNFNAALIGFIDDVEVSKRITDFVIKHRESKAVLDPIMGDNGKLYSGTRLEQIEFYKSLIPHAEIILPNITEGMILSGVDLSNFSVNDENLKIEILKKLKLMGAKNILLKGEPDGENFINTFYDGKDIYKIKSKYIHNKFHGTGDLLGGMIAVLAANDEINEKKISVAQNIISEILKNETGVEELLPNFKKLNMYD